MAVPLAVLTATETAPVEPPVRSAVSVTFAADSLTEAVVYADQAAQQKLTVDQIGRIYAPQILQAAPAGTWFHQESGAWVQK